MWIEISAAFVGGAILGGALLALRMRSALEHKLRAKSLALEDAQHEERLALREEASRARITIENERIELNREIEAKRHALTLTEDKLHRKESSLETDEAQLELQRQRLAKQEKALHAAEHEATKQRRLYQLKLHALTQMDKADARRELLRLAELECAEEIRDLRLELLGQTEREIQDQAHRTLLAAMQRIAATPNSNATATVVTLPSEDLKGRIIGREGRNIRTFEQTTGTTLMIDETPDSVLISCFDPVRREIARIALEELVRDGRIHPASIEEAVTKATDEMRNNVIELGESALRRVRISNVHPEIIHLLGKLNYRLSNNQNTLDHSIEVANLCALIAAEIGLDTNLAKRAGLFHDIGKSIDEEYEGSHATAGAEVLKQHSEDERVVNAVAAHHKEIEATSAFAPLVMIADSLSAVRPGARTSSIDGFIQRVRSIEEIAKEETGVTEAYAIQAGREIRVIVSPDKLGEEGSRQLARRLRKRIEEELTYPGSIQITVIREQRFTETAI